MLQLYAPVCTMLKIYRCFMLKIYAPALCSSMHYAQDLCTSLHKIFAPMLYAQALWIGQNLKKY